MSTGMGAPLVTVITATYNCCGALKMALQSLLNQDFRDFEAWVIGDACTDDSERIVRELGDSRLNWFNRSVNSGSQSGPNNEGLRRARGRYVAYLGHDDLWFPWHLGGLVNFIERAGVDLVYSLSARIVPDAELLSACGRPPKGRSFRNHHIHPSSWLHRRSLVEDCGFWSNPWTIARGVDDEYLVRVDKAGKAISFCPQLSVLKFPSGSWRMYSIQNEFPQTRYLEEMAADAKHLEHRILLSLSIIAAELEPLRHVGKVTNSAPRALLESIRIIGRRLAGLYGRDHWPLPHIQRWTYQRRRRRKAVRLRGLSREWVRQARQVTVNSHE